MLKLTSNSYFSISHHRSKGSLSLILNFGKIPNIIKARNGYQPMIFNTATNFFKTLKKLSKESGYFKWILQQLYCMSHKHIFRKGCSQVTEKFTFQLILTPDTFMCTDGLNHLWKKYIQWKSMSFAGYDRN